MSDYTQVSEALSKGADPAMLCSTCPWDRFCITPPSMTRAEVESSIESFTKKAEVQVEEDPSKAVGGMMRSLVATMVYAGRDTQASVCPVFALRMRSSDGRRLVDAVRDTMRSWDDNAVPR